MSALHNIPDHTGRFHTCGNHSHGNYLLSYCSPWYPDLKSLLTTIPWSQSLLTKIPWLQNLLTITPWLQNLTIIPWSQCLLTIISLITKSAHRNIPYHTGRFHTCSHLGHGTSQHTSPPRRCHRWPSWATHLQALPPDASEILWNCTEGGGEGSKNRFTDTVRRSGEGWWSVVEQTKCFSTLINKTKWQYYCLFIKIS